jgi:intraflagellar transport protein 172
LVERKRYVVARTSQSMLVADTETQQYSEVLWDFSEDEEFNFENKGLVLVRSREEVSAIQLGTHEILGSIRTDFYHKKLLSGRVSPEKGTQQDKLLCYLLDTQTACVLDLNTKMNVCLVEHDAMITGLDLDPTGTKLLFKDSNNEVHLFDTTQKTKVSLSRNAQFWGWVPESDVIICHSGDSLQVWYSSDHLQNWTSHVAKGKVVRLESGGDHQTKAVLLDGNIEREVELDDLLIKFNFALKRNDFGKCLSILGEDYSQKSSFHWKNLLKVALEKENYFVVEKCYAAMGDYSKQSFFRQINKLKRKGEEGSWEVKVELALLRGQYGMAENLLVERDMRDRAMEVFQDMHRWEDAIRLGKQSGQGTEMQEQFIKWLLESGQNLKAGEMLLNSGEVDKGVDLFIQEGLPGMGARKMLGNKVNRSHSAWEKVETQCESQSLFWILGEVYLYRGKRRKALNAFIKGNHFAKAVQLARKEQPEIVVGLHEKWGDHLHKQGDLEEAVHHFIEASNVKKAVESSLEMGDWAGAIRLAEGLQGGDEKQFREDIGSRLRERGHFLLAEKQLVKAGKVEEAVSMWLSEARFSEAERVCRENKLQQKQIRDLFCGHAETLSEGGKLREAEKVYLSLGLSDEAIRMYKKESQWRDMLRLFKEFRRENLKEAYVLIGKRLENSKEYGEAEDHFLRGGQWRLALKMYESAGQVGESLRILREFGTPEETTGKLGQYEQMEGPKTLEKLLRKMHMSDVLVDYLCSKEKFPDAFLVAENARHKLEETHLRFGEHLTKKGQLSRAEEEFGKVNRWDVAVQMYISLERFPDALRVARKVGKDSVKAVHLKEGDHLAQSRQFPEMENSYVEGGQPDRAVAVYLEEGMLPEALRVAKKFCRSRVKEVMEQMEIQKQNMSGEEMLRHARLLEDSGAYAKAVDVYLAMGTQHLSDRALLVNVWEKAVQLSFSHDKQRYSTVVLSVARKLETVGRFDLAGKSFDWVNSKGIILRMWAVSLRLWRTSSNQRTSKEPKQLQKEIRTRDNGNVY